MGLCPYILINRNLRIKVLIIHISEFVLQVSMLKSTWPIPTNFFCIFRLIFRAGPARQNKSAEIRSHHIVEKFTILTKPEHQKKRTYMLPLATFQVVNIDRVRLKTSINKQWWHCRKWQYISMHMQPFTAYTYI